MTDPFASNYEKVPSLPFPIGKKYRAVVTRVPKEVDKRVNGKVDTWPNGDPKKTVVTEVEVDGVKHSIWAERGSDRFKAIAAAQQAAGTQIAVGGVLEGGCTGETDGKGTFKKKTYAFTYTAPNAFGNNEDDAPPWAVG